MADDLSIRGKNGSNVRRFSRMRNGEQTPNANTRDPSRGIPQAPANFGRGLIPQIITFAGRSSTWAKIYRNPDAAIQNSRQNAESMRADTDIMECLEARQRGTSLLNWHLEPEDNKDPKQKQLVADLTDILEHTPRFTEYRRNLLDALWYGRTAVQHQYGWKKIKGKRRMTISHWLPIHGDKLVFRYDDGRGDYDDRSVGIRVGGQYNSGDIIAGNRKLEPTDWGLAYFLEPWERSLLAIHRHIIEDGAYENPLSAGRIHGVGIRDRIYWAWYQKQETLAHLMEVIQRTGTGFTIYWYQSGNAASEAKMTQIAQEQNSENVLVIPRSPDPSIEAEGIDRIEPNSGGIAILKEVVHEFFGHKIKRYIMGQVLSSESAATGLGSGVADLHQDTYYSIIAYDACGLEETITTDTVEPLKNFNFPWARDINIRFQIDTESNQSDKKMNALRQAWEIGARIKESEVMEIVGASIPSQDDYVLQNPSMMQQQRLWDQSQAQQQGPVDPAAAVGENPSVQDMFGPLLTQGPEGEEPQAGDEGGDQPPPQGPPSQGPAMYAKVKPQQGQSAFVWHEEDHPRDDAGKFTDKHTEEEHPAATAAAELPEGYSPSSYEVGRAGITKSQAMQQAMGDSKAKLARYDQMVKATYLYTGTKPEQWKAVPIEGMESVDNGQGGQVEMPRFSMPSGYQPVRTPHSDASGISGNACCELCGHNIKKAYYIQNDDHRLTMAVGSECVTNFGEGESGDRIAKKSQWAANRDLLKQAWEAFDRLGDAYAGRDRYGQHFLPTLGNDAYWRMLREMGVRNEKDIPAEKRQQIKRKADEVTKLFAELHGVLHNTAGAPVHHEGTTVKQTIWTGSGYNTRQREHTSRYDAASDAAITRWVKSNGDKVREMLEKVDQLTGQGSTAMQVVSRYQRIRYKAPPSPLPGPPDHAATPAELQQHRVGETKSQNGHTYRLNENHRWERADDDASSDTVDMHGDNTELADDHANDHVKRVEFVQQQLGGTHEAVRGIIGAFHQSKRFKDGAEVATRDLHPKQADQLYNFLKQNAGQRNQGKKVQGGWAVDLGEGRMGYASAAGSIVVWPPDQNGRRLVSYTAKTAIVNKSGGLDESVLPDGKVGKPKTPADDIEKNIQDTEKNIGDNKQLENTDVANNATDKLSTKESTKTAGTSLAQPPVADDPRSTSPVVDQKTAIDDTQTPAAKAPEAKPATTPPATALPPELASLDDDGIHGLLKSLGVKTKKNQDRASLEKAVSDSLYGPRGYRPAVSKEKSARLKAAEAEAMKRLGIPTDPNHGVTGRQLLNKEVESLTGDGNKLIQQQEPGSKPQLEQASPAEMPVEAASTETPSQPTAPAAPDAAPDAAHEAVAKRFGIPAHTVKQLLETHPDELAKRDEYLAPSNTLHDAESPTLDYPKHEHGTPKIDSMRHKSGETDESYVDYMRDFDPQNLKFSEDTTAAKGSGSVEKYKEWLKAGHKPPPISVFDSNNGNGDLVSTNRRRVMAAQEAGAASITGWHGPYNKETGNPLKLGDIKRAYAEAQQQPAAPAPQPENESPAEEAASLGLSPRGLAKRKGVSVQEAMGREAPKPVPVKPAKQPRKTWRDNLEGHLKLHGIEPTPEHLDMVQKAMQSGHISDHAHLKNILKQAAKNHGKGDLTQSITPHLAKSIDDRARRAEERTPRHTFESRTKAAAKQYGLSEHEVAAHAQSLYDAHPDFGYQAQREAARKRARELTGLNSNIQNSSGDAASEQFAKKDLARKGRQLASEFPTLGWGQGFGSGDENQDYESKIWELLKEGERTPPSMASDEFWNHVNEHLEGMKPQQPTDKAEFSPEDELSEEDRQQLEEDLRNNRSRLNEWGEDTAIPFSKKRHAAWHK